MSDDGYTLAEAMAALAILGLAIGGLGVVVSLIARQQLTAMRLHDRLADARSADQALGDLTADGDMNDLVGDTQNLAFPCGSATCAAALRPDGRRTLLLVRERSGVSRRLRLRNQTVRFGYVGPAGVVDAWPQPVKPGEATTTASAIVLTAGNRPVAVTRLWPREPRDCQFDVISGACRAVAL